MAWVSSSPACCSTSTAAKTANGRASSRSPEGPELRAWTSLPTVSASSAGPIAMRTSPVVWSATIQVGPVR